MKRIAIILLYMFVLSSCNQKAKFQEYNKPEVWEQSQAEPNRIYSGIEYILKGFEQFNIVAIGETHGIKEVTDFYIELIKNDDFRKQVDVVVFELANSLYQKDLDDYIFGISNDSLTIKKVWRDHTSSFLQSGDRTGVSRFLQEVRNINLKSEHKIRVLAAEPPIEWSKVNKSEDLFEVIAQRDAFYGDLVKTEVINENKKALLIMGSAHFNKCKPPHHVVDNPISTILKASNENLVLIHSMTLDDFPYGVLPEMNVGDVIETMNPIVGDLKIDSPFQKDYNLKVQTDALLYLGDMKNLTNELHTPFNDPEYMMELNRRQELIKMK